MSIRELPSHPIEADSARRLESGNAIVEVEARVLEAPSEARVEHLRRRAREGLGTVASMPEQLAQAKDRIGRQARDGEQAIGADHGRETGERAAQELRPVHARHPHVADDHGKRTLLPQELERVRNWLERALLERAEKILDAANAVIANNAARKPKVLWNWTS